jgi:hypothetical protein
MSGPRPILQVELNPVFGRFDRVKLSSMSPKPTKKHKKPPNRCRRKNGRPCGRFFYGQPPQNSPILTHRNQQIVKTPSACHTFIPRRILRELHACFGYLPDRATVSLQIGPNYHQTFHISARIANGHVD